jgi:hypothetical protein
VHLPRQTSSVSRPPTRRELATCTGDCQDQERRSIFQRGGRANVLMTLVALAAHVFVHQVAPTYALSGMLRISVGVHDRRSFRKTSSVG